MVEDRYQFVRELGRGANGYVTAEFDTQNQLIVARKYLSNSGLSATDIKREFRQMADAHHPNLVSLFELESDSRGVSFTMELVEDAANIVDYARAHPTEISDLFKQALSACAYLHGHNFVHRDLKPSNILVDEGRVVILDFGLATLAGNSSDGNFTGTPRFAAPEQLLGQEVTPKSDLFSLGVVFAEILEGGEYDWIGKWRTRSISTDLTLDSNILECIDSMLSMDVNGREDAATLLRRLGQTNSFSVEKNSMFLGRSEELEMVTKRVAGIHVVVGESGVGKSRFLHEASTRLRKEGFNVAQGRCRVWENIGFQAIDEIVGTLSRITENVELTHLEEESLAEAFKIVSLRRYDLDVDRSLKREAICTGLYKLMSVANVAGPLAVIIDDLQWIDRDSLAVLEFLLTTDLFESAKLLVGCRAEDRTQVDALFSESQVLTLRPLTADQATALIKSKGEFSNEEIMQMIESCEGSPYFLLEAMSLISDYSDTVLTDREFILQAKFERLSSKLQPVVDLICVSRDSIGESFAEKVLDSTSLHYDLLELEKMGWVRPLRSLGRLSYEPFHSRIREYVEQRLGEDGVPLHNRIASTLELVDPQNYEGLSFHYEKCNEPQAAGAFAFKAAIAAEERLAFDSASSYFSKAAQLGRFDDDERAEINFRHSRVKFNLGKCRDAALQASELEDNSYVSREEIALFVANSWFSAGYLEQGLDSLGDFLSANDLAEPSRNFLWVKLLFQIVKLRVTALREPKYSYLRSDVRMSDVYWSLGKLNMMSTKHGTYFQLLALSQYREQGNETKTALGLAVFSNVLTHLGMFSDFSDKCMAKAVSIGNSKQNAMVLGTCELWQTHRELSSENWFAAQSLAETAIQHMESANLGLTWECTTAKNFLLMSLEKLGEIERVVSEASIFLQQANLRGDFYAKRVFGLFLAYWTIPSKDLQETLTELESLSSDWSSEIFTIQDFYLLRIRVYALLYHGETERAHAELSQSWPKIESSDVLDVTSSALDALFMNGLVQLRFWQDGGEWQESAWRRTNLRLTKSTLSEGKAYSKLLTGMYFSLSADHAAARFKLLEACEIFLARDSRIAADYCRYAQNQSRGELAVSQDWLESIMPKGLGS